MQYERRKNDQKQHRYVEAQEAEERKGASHRRVTPMLSLVEYFNDWEAEAG